MPQPFRYIAFPGSVGRGATGAVYLARDAFTRQELAIKLASAESLRDPVHGAAVRRSLRERYQRLLLDEFQEAGKMCFVSRKRRTDAKKARIREAVLQLSGGPYKYFLSLAKIFDSTDDANEVACIFKAKFILEGADL